MTSSPSGNCPANFKRKSPFDLMMGQSASRLKKPNPENEEKTGSSENLDDYNFDSEDIGTRDNSPGPADLSKCPKQPPTQPVKHQYPGIEMRKKMRRFQKDYYQAFPWIEWSESTNRVFCYYCRHFCIDIGPSAKRAFTHDGYQKYDTIREALKTHQISQAHTTAATMYSEFKSRVDTDSSRRAAL